MQIQKTPMAPCERATLPFDESPLPVRLTAAKRLPA